MPISQQKLIKLEVEELKNLRDFELDFQAAPLTAIMGTNGSGKSTVLHALACAYSQPEEQEAYKFPMFFKPSTDALWAGSAFAIHYEQRDGVNYQRSLTQRYSKAADRWAPRYDKRPERSVRLITIRESVPEVETLGINSMVHYRRSNLDGDTHNRVREAAGQILNRHYAEYHRVHYQRGWRPSIAVRAGNINYSALSMSAGEQRVFRILDAVFSAPNYALILVDEIDIFLHQDALKKLVDVLHEHCGEKNKQLVFTTHFPPVADMYEKVSVRTLHRVANKTLVWLGYSYDALQQITGQMQRPLQVYVEDDVAEAIVREVARPLRVRAYLSVGRYGSGENAFSLGAGLALSNVDLNRCLIVLDGDINTSKGIRKIKVAKFLTGNEPGRDTQRKQLRGIIRPLRTPGLEVPERVLHRLVTQLDDAVVPPGDVQFVQIVRNVVNVLDRHGYVGEIVRLSGETRAYALAKMVELASLSPGWAHYTRLIRTWLSRQRDALNLQR
ncbi:AAA family ATPase [Cupriavidus sp. amp6]|uniref:AAA family ATPase n=1 Tax=Cupriavidus sp. amp6 TaxID=388051 RepID=UPI00041EE720|nr:AAA family ATPase [Cupriavidus sp. amp6]